MQNIDFWTLITSLYVSQTSPAVLCLQCSVISTRTTCLYGFQPFSVVFAFKTAPFGAELQVCIGPRPHLTFCQCKSAWLAPEILVSMGPRHNLSFCACKTAWFAPEWQVYMGSSPHLCFFFMQNSEFMTRLTSLYGVLTSYVVFACKPATFGHISMGPRTHLWFSSCKTPCLASQLLVFMCPSPHLWFLHSKQRPLEPNNKSLWVPDITCRFVQAIQRD